MPFPSHTQPERRRQFLSLLFSYLDSFVFGIRSTRRRKAALAAIVGLLLTLGAPAAAVMNPAECSVPASLTGNPPIRPNVMMLLDTSGSMNEEAYMGAPDTVFDPDRSYYGYFEPARCYNYSSNRFNPGVAAGPQFTCDDPAWPFSGSFMNWAFMTRFEVVKKVLVGGRWNGASGRIDGEGDERIDPHTYCFDASPWTDVPTGTGVWVYRAGSRAYLRTMSGCRDDRQGETGYSAGYCSGGHCVGPASTAVYGAYLRIGYAGEEIGIVQRLQAQVRWGLGRFNTSEGGRVVSYYGYNVTSMVNAVRTVDATDWTPTAEALHNMIRFHRRESSYYYGSDYNATGSNFDPWYQHESNPKVMVPCRKTSILVLTDGEPTQDTNIPPFLRDYDGDGNDPRPSGLPAGWPPAAHPEWTEPFSWVDNATEYLDDVALWANTVDHRADLDGKQSIASHYVYAFGRNPIARYVLWQAALQGGFDDKNGNGRPDLHNEWDEDGDGVPDAFHIAEDGNQLERALTKALATILKRTSSGTSVAVLGQSGEGEAAVIQAYYNPEMSDGITTVTWLGFTRGLWLDRWGNLREDSSGPGTSPAESVPDHALVLQEDKIIRYRFDAGRQETLVELYADPEGDGVTAPTDLLTIKTLHELNSLFEAGRSLYDRDPASRRIYVTAPDDSRAEFDPAAATWLWTDDLDNNSRSDWLDVGLGQESQDLIRFIRGESAEAVSRPDWRVRELLLDGAASPRTWKLGSVMHSTPVLVGAPPARFDQIYGDASYSAYFTAHTNRPQAVYVGANDGMLHAFFMGRFRNGPRIDKPTADAWYQPGCAPGYACTGTPKPGDELWAWIPRAALPTLQFQKEPELCHVYYVDGAPQVFDARIFPPDALHVQGWGTLLVVSTRLGCTPRTVAGRRFGPSVLVLDVTDPFDPRLLWEFEDAGLGYATSQPVIARIAGDWFLLFGSGPDDFRFRLGRTPAALYAVNMSRGFAVDRLPLPAAVAGEWTHRPLAVDLNLDYDVDLIYLATAIPRALNDHDGRILRIVPRDAGGSTPTTWNTGDWTIRTTFESDAPFAAAPRFGFDNYGKKWLYAGTGRYYDAQDRNYMEQQRVLGLRDVCLDDPDCTDKWDEADLEPVGGCAIRDDGTLETGCASSGDTPTEVCEKVMSKQGWRLDFPAAHPGERMLTRTLLERGVLAAPTWTPEAGGICTRGGGTGRIWYLDQRCGIAWKTEVICTDCQILDKPPGPGLAPTDRGELLRSDNPSDFSELSGVQMFMTPYLEE